MFDIKDRPGLITKALMRQYFEGAVNETAGFKAITPLGIITLNGEFSHYADPDTDTMWIGFAIGMRCAERLRRAQVSEAPATGKPGLHVGEAPAGAVDAWRGEP